AGAGGGERQMRALGAPGDAPRLHDVAEQIEVDEVEAHGALTVARRQAMPDTHCARDFQGYVSPTAKSKRVRLADRMVAGERCAPRRLQGCVSRMAHCGGGGHSLPKCPGRDTRMGG